MSNMAAESSTTPQAPEPIRDPAMITVTHDILRHLESLAGITTEVRTNCLLHNSRHHSIETFFDKVYKNDQPELVDREEPDDPEETSRLVTTLDLAYRPVLSEMGINGGYNFSISYDGESAAATYTNRYALLCRASGLLIFGTVQGRDDPLMMAKHDPRAIYPIITPGQILELRAEVQRLYLLSDKPDGGVRVPLPV